MKSRIRLLLAVVSSLVSLTASAGEVMLNADPSDPVVGIIMCNTGSNPGNHDGPIPGRPGWHRSSCYNAQGVFIGSNESTVDPFNHIAYANFITPLGEVRLASKNYTAVSSDEIQATDPDNPNLVNLIIVGETLDDEITYTSGIYKLAKVNKVSYKLVMQLDFSADPPVADCRFGLNVLQRVPPKP